MKVTPVSFSAYILALEEPKLIAFPPRLLRAENRSLPISENMMIGRIQAIRNDMNGEPSDSIYEENDTPAFSSLSLSPSSGNTPVWNVSILPFSASAVKRI